MKKTIAIVGATKNPGKAIVKKFASMPYRLLLISNEVSELNNLRSEMSAMHPEAEIEALDCVKDGCWEADIIILAVPAENMKQVAERIKEVATQKIVVEIFTENDIREEVSKILPYSKLVNISQGLQSEIIISGDNNTVNEEISMIFKQAGYNRVIIESSLSIL